MRGPKIVFEHDLDLYRKQATKVYGIGPKYLWDQVPDSHRQRAEANHGNLFRLSLDLPQDRIERVAIDGFYLPWSLRTAIQPARLEAFRDVLRSHYSAKVLAAEKFNAPI
jgi:hypothetical protein